MSINYKITYGSDVIAEGADTVTLLCNGKKMLDDLVIEAVEVAEVKECTVTITLTNPINVYGFAYVDIYDDHEWNPNGWYYVTGNKIGSISSATGSTTVITSTGKLYIEISGTFPFLEGDVTVTGGVTIADHPANRIEYRAYNVSGDGTIVLDRMNYDG